LPNFYFDIETSGLDPSKEKIITIQFMELDRNSSEKKGELTILKEWESEEKEIINKFISESHVNDPYPFTFIPMGYNLSFEHKFIIERCNANSIKPIDILNKPFIDLKPLAVIMNNGEFKGCGLDKITGKPNNGSIIPQLYKEKKWDKIEDYIKTETEEFVKFCSWLYSNLPPLLRKFKLENISSHKKIGKAKKVSTLLNFQ